MIALCSQHMQGNLALKASGRAQLTLVTIEGITRGIPHRRNDPLNSQPRKC